MTRVFRTKLTTPFLWLCFRNWLFCLNAKYRFRRYKLIGSLIMYAKSLWNASIKAMKGHH